MFLLLILLLLCTSTGQTQCKVDLANRQPNDFLLMTIEGFYSGFFSSH